MSAAENSSLLTPSQLGWVLCDIAQTAKAVERMSILLNHCEDERDMETFILSIGNLAQRIGWAADMALDRTTENIGACYGGAEQWMMPPVFHDDATPHGHDCQGTTNDQAKDAYQPHQCPA